MSRGLISYKARKTTTRIIYHDSHTEPTVGSGREVDRWAAIAKINGLDMGLLGVGYNYIIERDGTVVEARHHSLIGNHTPGHNMDSISVCLVGGRECGHPGVGFDNFTRKQRMATIRLTAELLEIYGPLKLLGHTEVQRYRNKSLPDCPCFDMDEFRQDVLLYQHNKEILDASGIL